MNITISSLAISRQTLSSPFFTSKSSAGYNRLVFHNINANKFSHNFLYFNILKTDAYITKSKFSKFLNSPLVFHEANTNSSKVTITSEVNISNTNFFNNTATFFGGAIEIDGDLEIFISSCNLEYNSAQQGGAIFADGTNLNLTISSSHFNYNSALCGSDLFLSLCGAVLDSTQIRFSEGNYSVYVQSANSFSLLYTDIINTTSDIRVPSGLQTVLNASCIYKEGQPTSISNQNVVAEGICSFATPLPTPTTEVKLGTVAYIIIAVVAFFLILSILGVILGSRRAKKLPDNMKLLEESDEEPKPAEGENAAPAGEQAAPAAK